MVGGSRCVERHNDELSSGSNSVINKTCVIPKLPLNLDRGKVVVLALYAWQTGEPGTILAANLATPKFFYWPKALLTSLAFNCRHKRIHSGTVRQVGSRVAAGAQADEEAARLCASEQHLPSCLVCS